MNLTDWLHLPLMQRALWAALAGGAGCGLLGVLIVGLRIPFIGVAAAHGAMAGAVAGHLLGVSPVAGAFAGSCLAVWLIGPLIETSRQEHELAVGIVFSTMLGLTFLGMSLAGGEINRLLALLWGSILLLPPDRLVWMSGATVLVIALIVGFYPGLRALLVSRKLAAASGLRDAFLMGLVLTVVGLSVAVYLEALGGLLIFAVLIAPAATARLFARSLPALFVASAALGAGGCLAGVLLSAWWNVGTGAMVIVVLCAAFFIVLIFRRREATRYD